MFYATLAAPLPPPPAQWDLGWLIWLWIFIIVAALCWAGVLLALGGVIKNSAEIASAKRAGGGDGAPADYNPRDRRRQMTRLRDDEGQLNRWLAFGAGCLGVALLVGAIGTFISLPWSGQYHRYVPKGGVVLRVGSRFIASDTSGGGSTQKYVVTFANGQSYGCLDTRCSLVRPGDQMWLLCERSFQLNAPNPGWDCNWAWGRRADGRPIS